MTEAGLAPAHPLLDMPPSERFISAARPHSITDTRLFAALTALGIQPVEWPTIYAGETPDGKPRQTWFMAPTSLCGQYNTAEMITAWHSKAWMDGHPEHPLAYIKAAFENMSVAVDHCKDSQHHMHVIRGRGGKIGLLGPNDPRAIRENILKTLKR
jgi:hypothetical protein